MKYYFAYLQLWIFLHNFTDVRNNSFFDTKRIEIHDLINLFWRKTINIYIAKTEIKLALVGLQTNYLLLSNVGYITTKFINVGCTFL